MRSSGPQGLHSAVHPPPPPSSLFSSPQKGNSLKHLFPIPPSPGFLNRCNVPLIANWSSMGIPTGPQGPEAPGPTASSSPACTSGGDRLPRALSPASCLSPGTPGLTGRLPSRQQLPSFLWFGWSVISSTDRRILSLLCSNLPHLLSPHLEITCWGLSEPRGPLPPLSLIWHWELTVRA